MSRIVCLDLDPFSAIGAGGLGGLQGLIAKFQQGGLGDVVASWISNNTNLPISADQIQSALGQGPLQDVASKMGLRPGTWAYVGDSGIDQATALAANVPFFVVPWGGSALVKVADGYRLTRLRDLV